MIRVCIKLCRLFEKNNLTLNRDKCVFGVQSIKFMGEIVSSEGIAPDPEKITAIQNLSQPTCKNDLQKFLGMVNYLARFLPELSHSTEVLRELLKKSKQWCWSEVHNEAWNKLKTLVSKSPVLSFYDPNKPIKIASDASKSALGAVLLQCNAANQWQPIAYASRPLSQAELNYAQITKELLSIVFACDRFHQYIYAKHFTVETDHSPLIPLFSKELSKYPIHVQRLLKSLQRYDFTAYHVPGKFMYTADVLSRFVNHENSLPPTQNEILLNDHTNAVVATITSSLSSNLIKELQCETLSDKQLSIVKSYVLQGWPEHRKMCDILAKEFWQFKDELSFIDGLLFRGNCVIIPFSLRKKYLDRLHFGHLGESKCKARARESIFWPGITNDIIHTVSSCDVCARFSPQNAKEPLLPHPEPLYPFQRVGLDLFNHDSKDYVILVDYYSSYPEVIPVSSTKASYVINVLKSTFARWGSPETLISDNAPQLVCAEFDEFCAQWEIDHTTSSPYLPRSNGMSERGVRSAKQLIKKCIESSQDFYQALLILRSSPLHCGLSPAQLLMGRRLRNNLPIFSNLLNTNSSNFSRNFSEEKARYKYYYDQHSKPLPELHVGTYVYMYNTVKKIWDTQAQVIEKLSDRSYLLKTIDNVFYRRNRVHLKPKVFPFETPFNQGEASPVLRRSARARKQLERLMY